VPHRKSKTKNFVFRFALLSLILPLGFAASPLVRRTPLRGRSVPEGRARTSDLQSRSTLCVASARLRVLKKVLSFGARPFGDASACQRQVWKKSKTKNFVFRFALLSLIRTFVGEFVKTINK